MGRSFATTYSHNATATTSTGMKTPAGHEEFKNSDRPIGAKTMGNERLKFFVSDIERLSYYV